MDCVHPPARNLYVIGELRIANRRPVSPYWKAGSKRSRIQQYGKGQASAIHQTL